jgi:hypothetical protein
MGTGEKNSKEMSLRDYVVALTILMIVSAFPFYLIFIPIIRFRLYEDLFFYLSTLAIATWWGLSYASRLILEKRGKVRIAAIVIAIELLLGLFGALVLDAILGYKTVLPILSMLVVIIWVTIFLIIKMILHIWRGYGH